MFTKISKNGQWKAILRADSCLGLTCANFSFSISRLCRNSLVFARSSSSNCCLWSSFSTSIVLSLIRQNKSFNNASRHAYHDTVSDKLQKKVENLSNFWMSSDSRKADSSKNCWRESLRSSFRCLRATISSLTFVFSLKKEKKKTKEYI